MSLNQVCQGHTVEFITDFYFYIINMQGTVTTAVCKITTSLKKAVIKRD